jgi:mRNA interferase MazF
MKKMQSGIQFKQGDIVIVPFPFSDLRGMRQRPVLIISNNEYNNNYEDIITCGITSNLKNANHSILFDNDNLSEGEIPKKSRIKVDKLFTLEKSIIKKKIAKLNTEYMAGVKEEFMGLV